jgi:putative flippase GtrA
MTDTGIGKFVMQSVERLCGKLGLSTGTFWQFIKYIICGVTAFSCELASFSVLEYLIWPLLGIGMFESEIAGVVISRINISNTISISLGYIIAFTLNRVWSFKSKSNLLKQFLKSFVLYIFNIIASNIMINIFVETLGLHKISSKVLSMAIIVMWNFILYKKVIYK